MKPGQPVNLAGVQVGYVDAVDLDETGYLNVRLSIDRSRRFRRAPRRRWRTRASSATSRSRSRRAPRRRPPISRRHLRARDRAPAHVDLPLQRLSPGGRHDSRGTRRALDGRAAAARGQCERRTVRRREDGEDRVRAAGRHSGSAQDDRVDECARAAAQHRCGGAVARAHAHDERAAQPRDGDRLDGARLHRAQHADRPRAICRRSRAISIRRPRSSTR